MQRGQTWYVSSSSARAGRFSSACKTPLCRVTAGAEVAVDDEAEPHCGPFASVSSSAERAVAGQGRAGLLSHDGKRLHENWRSSHGKGLLQALARRSHGVVEGQPPRRVDALGQLLEQQVSNLPVTQKTVASVCGARQLIMP